MSNVAPVLKPITWVQTLWQLWGRRVRVLSGAAIIQVLVQFMSAVVGFILVRTLGKGEYAWFTIAGSMAAMMSSLGDSGAQTGLMSIGGRVYQDSVELSRVVATALRLRFLISGIALILVAPASWYLLVRNGAPWSLAAAMVGTVSLAVGPSAMGGVMSVALRLTGRYQETQLAELAGAGSRLLGSGLVVLVAPFSVFVVAATSMAQWVQALMLRRAAGKFLDFTIEPSAAYRSEQLHMVRMLWFPTLFAAFQGQLGTWILSYLGAQAKVADLGAIGRFAAVFSVVISLIQTIVAPAFARCQERARLIGLVLQAVAGLTLICGALLALFYSIPWAFMWVLGPNYSHLTNETGLFFLLSSVSALTTLMWSLVSSRGWVGLTWMIPPVTILFQVSLPFILNVATVSGAIWLMIIASLPALAITLGMALRGLRGMVEVSNP
jgi:uncharacterized membrane protein YqjE